MRVGSDVQFGPVREVCACVPGRWNGKCKKELLVPPQLLCSFVVVMALFPVCVGRWWAGHGDGCLCCSPGKVGFFP